MALVRSLARDPIDTSAIERIAGVPTGTAAITVDSRGHNRIVVVPGANGAWTASHVEAIRSLIAQSNVLLLQLEIPLEAVARAVTIAREENVFCMVNPAPALPLPADFYPSIDLLTPNENELGLLSGITLGGPRGWRNAARVLLNRGLPAIVVTLGEEGSLAMDDKSDMHLPAYPVKMVDSTAAGDCFNGTLAAEIDVMLEARGKTCSRTAFTVMELAPAIDRATRAATISVTRRGAQPSIPWREEIDRFETWFEEHRL